MSAITLSAGPFKPGDIVSLKSGSSAMVVGHIRNEDGAVFAMFQVEGGAIHSGFFEAAVLRLEKGAA